MDNNCSANHSIKCSVKECKHHCASQEYCSLQSVTIGTHESNPTQKQCVDCESFECKCNNCTC